MVRIEEGKTRETLDRIGDYYREYNPGFTFDYQFIDQDYQFQYASEQRIGTLSKYFGGIAIIISCLGTHIEIDLVSVRKVYFINSFGKIHSNFGS